jgi:hypothetical protein
MNPGDKVIHIPTGRLLTVKETKHSGYVACCWLGQNSFKEPIELVSGFPWQELRKPTEAELAMPRHANGLPLTPTPGNNIPAAENRHEGPPTPLIVKQAPAETVETPAKSKGKK